MHKVIENFAPKELHQHIKDIMSSDNFAWFYHDFVADYYDKTADEFYFTHTFYSDKTKEVNSNWYNDIIHPILFVLIGKDYDLIRAKANLFTKTSEPVKYGFHTDYKFDKHTTLVYSVNTNNGYTEFKDGTKIPSIENQLLIFDGNTPHRSVGQSDIRNRMNLNINLKLDPQILINE